MIQIEIERGSGTDNQEGTATGTGNPPAVLLEMLLLITSLHCNSNFHTARSLLLQYYSSEML